jgi:carboxyl-terminal processing protease
MFLLRPYFSLRSAVVALAAGLALLGGGCASVPTSPAPRVAAGTLPKAEAEHAAANLRVFDTVWDAVHRKYYDPTFNGHDWDDLARTYGPRATAAKDTAALYDTLNEMLGQLNDSHTAAIEPRDANEERTGQRAIVGLTLRRVNGQWLIADVNPRGAAARAGVKPGWIAVKRDGVALGERYIRPTQQPGQVVRWEFLTPDGRTVVLDLEVQPLPTARLETRELAGGLAYIRFDGFDLTATRWLSQQLELHHAAPGVVLDLRHNSGGLIASALFAVGEFFPEAVPVFVTLDQKGERFRWASLQLGSAHYAGRVAVLTGAQTASAAEILSSVLQEKGRATIVGRRTAGALLAAIQARLPDQGLLQISELDVITMGGKRLEGEGLAPDVEIPDASLTQLRADEDPDLAAAIALLSKP